MAISPDMAPSRGYPQTGEKSEVKSPPLVFEYPFQQKAKQELVHLFGPEYTTAHAFEDFKERAKKFRNYFGALTPDIIDNSLSADAADGIASLSAKLKLSIVVFAIKLEQDLHASIESKLTEKMQAKYDPDMVTEIRLYGTEEDPGRKTGPEAMAILKKSFDKINGVQTYDYRGLPVPDDEERLRYQSRRFTDHFQDIGDWWQRRALGSDLVASERTENLIEPETGEIDEAIACFNSLGQTIDIDGAMEELADVWIGIDVANSAMSNDLAPHQEEELKRANDTYADLPRYRRMGIPLDAAIKFSHDKRDREESGQRLPNPPTPAAARIIYQRTN